MPALLSNYCIYNYDVTFEEHKKNVVESVLYYCEHVFDLEISHRIKICLVLIGLNSQELMNDFHRHKNENIRIILDIIEELFQNILNNEFEMSFEVDNEIDLYDDFDLIIRNLY